MAGHLINEWTNVVSEERNEIVFENRNKSYGAFMIRREYPRTVMIALLSTAAAVILIAVTPKIIELFKKSKDTVNVVIDNTQLDLTPPPVDPSEPPPPPPPPPPVMETVKFVPPVVVDKPVEDEPPPVQTEETPQISTETHEGTGDEIIIPDEGKGKGVVETKEEVFTVVEQMPSFPGGEDALYKYLTKNIQYPSYEHDNMISGKVYIDFTVGKDGTITDITEKRGVTGGPNLTKEAIRVIKTMPAWKPGRQNGRDVPVHMTLPVRFSLN